MRNRNNNSVTFELVGTNVQTEAYHTVLSADLPSVTVHVDKGEPTTLGDREVSQSEYPTFTDITSKTGLAHTPALKILDVNFDSYGISIIKSNTEGQSSISAISDIHANNMLKSIQNWKEVSGLQFSEDNPFLNDSAVNITTLKAKVSPIRSNEGVWTNTIPLYKRGRPLTADTWGVFPQAAFLKFYSDEQAQFQIAAIKWKQVLECEGYFKGKFPYRRELLSKVYRRLKRAKYREAWNEMSAYVSNDWLDVFTFNKYLKPGAILSNKSRGADTPLKWARLATIQGELGVSSDASGGTTPSLDNLLALAISHVPYGAPSKDVVEGFVLPAYFSLINQAMDVLMKYIFAELRNGEISKTIDRIERQADYIWSILAQAMDTWRTQVKSVRTALKYAKITNLRINWSQGYLPPEIKNPMISNFTMVDDLIQTACTGGVDYNETEGLATLVVPIYRSVNIIPPILQNGTGGVFFCPRETSKIGTDVYAPVLSLFMVKSLTVFPIEDADVTEAGQSTFTFNTDTMNLELRITKAMMSTRISRLVSSLIDIVPKVAIIFTDAAEGEIGSTTHFSPKFVMSEKLVASGFSEYAYAESLLTAPIMQS